MKTLTFVDAAANVNAGANAAVNADAAADAAGSTIALWERCSDELKPPNLCVLHMLQ